jgi:hypothetical protein
MPFSRWTRYVPDGFSWSAGGQGPRQADPAAWTAVSMPGPSAADGRGRKGYYTPGGTRDRLRYAGSLYDGDLYADALHAGRKVSVARMSAECAALGGDGVVAVRAGLSPCPWDGRAVASAASRRPPSPAP